jgi:hypothetical protein
MHVYRYKIYVRLERGKIEQRAYEAVVTPGEVDPEDLLRNHIADSGWDVTDWLLMEDYDEQASPGEM